MVREVGFGYTWFGEGTDTSRRSAALSINVRSQASPAWLINLSTAWAVRLRANPGRVAHFHFCTFIYCSGELVKRPSKTAGSSCRHHTLHSIRMPWRNQFELARTIWRKSTGRGQLDRTTVQTNNWSCGKGQDFAWESFMDIWRRPHLG